jgi:hypothetical protein
MIFLAMKQIISPRYLDASSFKNLNLCDNEEEMTERLRGIKHDGFMWWLNVEV